MKEILKNKKVIAAICCVLVVAIGTTIGVVVSNRNKTKIETQNTNEITETATVLEGTTSEEKEIEAQSADISDESAMSETKIPEQPNESVSAEAGNKQTPNTTKAAQTPQTTKAQTPATTKAPQTTKAPTPQTTQPPTQASWEWTDADLQSIVNKTKAYIKSKGYTLGGWNNTYYYRTQYNPFTGQDETEKVELGYDSPESSQYYPPDEMIKMGWSKQRCIEKILECNYDSVDTWGRQGHAVDCFYTKNGSNWKIYVVNG